MLTIARACPVGSDLLKFRRDSLGSDMFCLL